MKINSHLIHFFKRIKGAQIKLGFIFLNTHYSMSASPSDNCNFSLYHLIR